jgi:REP element-mobilizing transposase RayT
MSRPLRIEFPGAVYHITARGNEKKAIFRNDRDREKFVEILSLIIKRFKWICHSYCLMGNHYHILIETQEANLARGMKQLNGIYTQSFNHRYNRVGHLFQGRYKAILVEKESYLLVLSRYIVLNPVRAGLVNHPGEWPWSSYSTILEKVKKTDFLTVDWILSRFSPDKTNAVKEYIQFVLAGYMMEFPYNELTGQIFLGSEGFIRKVNGYLSKDSKDNMQEVPREQQLSLAATVDEIFQRKMREGISRNEIIYNVYNNNNFTMKEIGDYLGLHYTTISRIISCLENQQRYNERTDPIS